MALINYTTLILKTSAPWLFFKSIWLIYQKKHSQKCEAKPGDPLAQPVKLKCIPVSDLRAKSFPCSLTHMFLMAFSWIPLNVLEKMQH